MRWGLFFIVLGLATACSNSTPHEVSQETAKDSIQIWANTAKDNADLPIQQRFLLVNRAYKENQKLQNKASQVKNLSRISLAYSQLSDTLNFIKTNKELITQAERIGDYIAQGEAHWDMGSYFRRRKPDSSFYHYREAYTLFRQIDFENKDLKQKAYYPGSMLIAMARRKDDIKDYIGAEKAVTLAIQQFNAIDAKNQLYRAYNALAGAQSGLNKFDKALEYHKKAKDYIQFLPKTWQEQYYRSNLNNTAGVYLRKKDFQKAYELYTQLKDAVGEHKNSRLLIEYGYSSMAFSGFKSGNLNLEEAQALITLSNKGLDSLNNQYQKSRNYQYLSEILFVDGDFEKAIAYAEKGKEIAQTTDNNDRQLEILKLLSQIDEKNGQRHAKAYFDLSEKLQMQERNLQDKFALIQLETDEIIEENASLTKRTEVLGGISLGLLVLGIGIFTIVSQRISNQKLRFKEKQQESNQEIYGLMLAQHGKMEEGKKLEQKRMSEELHDGILGQMLGIRLILSGLNERNDPSAIEQRSELIVKLQELEEEIRTISHELNTAAYLKVNNFILSIEDLIATVEKSSGIMIAFDHDRHFDWDQLHSDIKINVYRVSQELLQNCVKHAQCKNVNISFEVVKKMLNLSFEDDGIGFDGSKKKKGIGLKNIISRVKKMDAHMEIQGKKGKGTTVNIEIPNIDLKRQHPNPISERNTVEA